MPGEDDRSRDYYGERPPPTIDPTKLTTEAVERAEAYLRELFEAKLEGKDDLYTEKFKRLTIQILERDTLREAAKIDANERIAAALQAAKEAVGKTETNFAEQLKSLNTTISTINTTINTTISTMADGLRREISDLKDRVLSSEGQKKGMSDTTAFMFVVITVIIAAAAVLVAFLHH